MIFVSGYCKLPLLHHNLQWLKDGRVSYLIGSKAVVHLYDIHVPDAHASISKAPLCSSLAHLVATDVEEAGVERGGKIGDHMLGDNLYCLVLQEKKRRVAQTTHLYQPLHGLRQTETAMYWCTRFVLANISGFFLLHKATLLHLLYRIAPNFRGTIFSGIS